MNRTSSRPSLLTRITEGQSRAKITVDRSYREAPRQESFVERYRGTEFDTAAPEIVIHREHMSRGRSFVLIVGTASVSLVGLLLAAAAG